jgi:hypothetical protein
LKATIIVLALIIAFCVGTISAQNGKVTQFWAVPGSTVADCGTPTTPSTCLVGSNFIIWQNATDGWFAPQKAGAVGPAGPVGATGPAGPAGAVGPTGPAGTVPSGVVLTVNGKPGPNVTLAIQ